jgi:glyoxylase-like metal-dependent hydrolase (beta-lactamase superfamily II)
MIVGLAIAYLATLAPAPAAVPIGKGVHFIEGGLEPGRQPDGNSVVFEAPDGLIVVDSGRHAEHQRKILALAAARRLPIAALVNTHWHLDHSGGNAELREAAGGELSIHASRAVEGALTGFLARSKAEAVAFLASGKADTATAAEIEGDIAAVDEPRSLLPTAPADGSGERRIAGRPLSLRLAQHAATAGDVWVYDAASGIVAVGDLVTLPVPFFDTACPEGWRRALTEIAGTPFTRLVPGHGAVMGRPEFMVWKRAFERLLDCAGSSRGDGACIAGWQSEAAALLGPDEGKQVDAMLGYYLKTRLRGKPGERVRYCPGGADG